MHYTLPIGNALAKVQMRRGKILKILPSFNTFEVFIEGDYADPEGERQFVLLPTGAALTPVEGRRYRHIESVVLLGSTSPLHVYELEAY
jgi:hypothetical protein